MLLPPPAAASSPIQALHTDSDAVGLRSIWHARVFETPPTLQFGLAVRLEERVASALGAPRPATDRTAIIGTLTASGTVGLLASKKE